MVIVCFLWPVTVPPTVTVSQSSHSLDVVAVTCHVQRFYPQNVHLSWLENCDMFKGAVQPSSKQNSDGTYTLESLHLVNASVWESERVLTCKAQHETQPPIQASLILSTAVQGTYKLTGSTGKLTSTPVSNCDLCLRVEWGINSQSPVWCLLCTLSLRSRDACPYLDGFPPGLKSGAGDQFHSHLFPQVVEPVTGKVVAVLFFRDGDQSHLPGVARGVRASSKIIRQSSFKGEMQTDLFSPNVFWNFRGFQLSLFCALEFEVSTIKLVGTLEVRVRSQKSFETQTPKSPSMDCCIFSFHMMYPWNE